MQKVRDFLKRMFDNPLEKMSKMCYAIVILMALAGLFVGFSSIFLQSLFGFDFGDFLEALLLGIIFAVVYGFVGWILGLSLRCYLFFLQNHQRQTEATVRQADAMTRIAALMEQSMAQQSDSSDDV